MAKENKPENNQDTKEAFLKDVKNRLLRHFPKVIMELRKAVSNSSFVEEKIRDFPIPTLVILTSDTGEGNQYSINKITLNLEQDYNFFVENNLDLEQFYEYTLLVLYHELGHHIQLYVHPDEFEMLTPSAKKSKMEDHADYFSGLMYRALNGFKPDVKERLTTLAVVLHKLYTEVETDIDSIFKENVSVSRINLQSGERRSIAGHATPSDRSKTILSGYLEYDFDKFFK
jgi:hypothetical protein